VKREKLIPDDHHMIQGESVSGKIIEIGAGEYQDFISDGALLIDCEIRILCSAASLNIFDATFENCLIKARRELKNYSFFNAGFRGCKFIGKYSGCRFGSHEKENTGFVEECDFSEAKLDLCDFFDKVEIKSLKFGEWPLAVITKIDENAIDWKNTDFGDEEFSYTQDVVADEPFASAVVIDVSKNADDMNSVYQILKDKAYVRV